MSGLTPTEAEVIKLHERGLSPGVIASALGLSVVRAGSIINHFRTDNLARCDDRERLAMELSSKALLKALQREGLAR